MVVAVEQARLDHQLCLLVVVADLADNEAVGDWNERTKTGEVQVALELVMRVAVELVTERLDGPLAHPLEEGVAELAGIAEDDELGLAEDSLHELTELDLDPDVCVLATETVSVLGDHEEELAHVNLNTASVLARVDAVDPQTKHSDRLLGEGRVWVSSVEAATLGRVREEL